MKKWFSWRKKAHYYRLQPRLNTTLIPPNPSYPSYPFVPESSELQPNQSSSTTNWLSLIETVGENLLVTTASIAAIIQGLDVIERRWREHKAKQHSATASASSTAKTSPADSEIVDILLILEDGNHHTFKRWVSDPNSLRVYIDAFSDPSSKVKPLQVVFRKREGRALVVDVTKGAKDNKPLDVILGYLEADPE
jgi:hypothetical protein